MDVVQTTGGNAQTTIDNPTKRRSLNGSLGDVRLYEASGNGRPEVGGNARYTVSQLINRWR